MELLCEQLLTSEAYSSPATLHGVTYEKQAIELFASLTKIKTQPCGLFIDPNIPYLGATPDAQIFPDGLIEVKCPYKGRDSQISITSPTFKSDFPFLEIKNQTISLNRQHKYFFQIQGQLGIAKKSIVIL